ncbi:uncharacterized protein GGS25DRAFT_534820 [Hypoxylon fragiforme]|uniref:uncharacterized protein n=1 Tax=Hypoxylon fragiforme TaxID=63214 RepID=UPI0020C6E867|nr:uncharacterized protein GGS25DRAFT_534820 [Hypoxylon fragiforme]KAI2604403.1 hypothetical protein GGS25DRAFT_534820 [Hypoxylon fragiforme]
MATTLAQIAVQYVPSNGGCMLDMTAAAARLFDVCSTVHIRIPDIPQQRIDVQSGMICIKPSEPVPSMVDAYREQYVYPTVAVLRPTGEATLPPKQQQQQGLRLPTFERPGRLAQGGVPMGSGGGDRKGDGNNDDDDDDDDEVQTSKGGQESHSTSTLYRHGPLSTMKTRVRPAQSTTCTTISIESTVQVTRLIETSDTSLLSTTSTPTTQLHASQPSNKPSSTLITSTISSPSPSQESSIYIPALSISTPQPQAPPAERPVTSALDPAPPAPTIPSLPQLPPPPPPPPTLPGYCKSPYFNLDVTTITALDPHDLALHLNLLGIAGLEHVTTPTPTTSIVIAAAAASSSGSSSIDSRSSSSRTRSSSRSGDSNDIAALLRHLLTAAINDDETRAIRREFERSYRVRCGTPLVPSFPWGKDPGKGKGNDEKGGGKGEERKVNVGSQRECLEMCEREAISRAREGVVRECVGAAWYRGLGNADADADADGNCMFWIGGRDEVLPVERLGVESVVGRGGDWDLVYL